MSKKNISFWDDARLAMFRGMEKLYKAVAWTLGPKGRNAIFSKSYGVPQVTNDGVTIAKEIELEDNVENMGAELIKDAASKTNDAAWDGTTTAAVLTYAMASEWLREIRSGINAVELKNGMKAAAEVVIRELIKNSQHVKTSEDIASVATISAQDEEAGKIIAEAMDKVGENGVITIEEGKTMGLVVDVTKGMKFKNGFISPYMITDPEKMEARMSDVAILVTDKKISSMKSLLPILEGLAQQGKRELAIVAEDVDGEALTGIVLNKLKGVFQILAVKAPWFGDRRKENLKDIALLTGATVISDEVWLKLDDSDTSILGRADSIVATREDTTIVANEADQNELTSRIAEIQKMIKASDSDYDREKMQERLARLAGGVAVIRVWAASEIEMKEKKLRLEDALNSTRAAVEEGIVPGGGVALLRAASVLESFQALNSDQQIGVNIVHRSLSYPTRKIVENAGEEGAVIVREILSNKSFSFGYNASTGKFVDLVQAGIIDPTKVARTALENAVSIAGMFLTTEAVISDVPEKHDHSHAHDMGGGMGGMPMM